jgi:hypothetical protein
MAHDSPAGTVEALHFATNDASLTPAQTRVLDAFVASWHATGAAARVRVDGHASSDGPEARNWTLSCQRAEAVRDALVRPASGVPGIPSTQIDLRAHGASSELGGDLAANRTATLSMLVAPPPAPVAPPGPTSGPTAVCGPDVSQQIRAAVSRTRTTFTGWSTSDRNSACGALTSVVTGGFAWDIVDLHNNAWILSYRPACASAHATPACGSTVAIDGECSYAGSPNYVIFGVMCKLCRDHYALTDPRTAPDFDESNMLHLIDVYKGTGYTGLQTPSPNFGPSNEWARAGYHGWPGVASPRGDRPTCSPMCPTPFGGSPFRVHWVPNGVF